MARTARRRWNLARSIGTAEAFDAALRRDHARWADVVKAVGVKGE